ncbi:MAG: thioredoxin family protein [Sediminibacterium sp.]
MKIIDFWAEWCQPCKMMEPILKEIEKEYPNITIEKVNVDEDTAKTQNFEISTIPTFVLVNEEGREIKRVKGAMPKYKLLKELGIDES